MLVATTATSPKLSALEIEVIDFFVELSALLGQPRSLAEIYGLLFISPHPLTMDDFVERLELSKGSASQGLKFLRDLGAVHEVDVPGDRRTHYEAVAELRKLAAQFLRGQFGPRLDSGLSRLDRIASLAKSVPVADREKLQHRVALLQNWGKRGKLLLPLIVKLMGK